MGSGAALAFKCKYPEMFTLYKELCNEGAFTPCKMWVYNVPDQNKKVLNIAVKEHWKHSTTYQNIEKVLVDFVHLHSFMGITSVAFPILGYGHGNLNKKKTLDLMLKHLKNCDIPIEIYEFV